MKCSIQFKSADNKISYYAETNVLVIRCFGSGLGNCNTHRQLMILRQKAKKLLGAEYSTKCIVEM